MIGRVWNWYSDSLDVARLDIFRMSDLESQSDKENTE
jgi:hypothetical protein